jgi:hypothetical protein
VPRLQTAVAEQPLRERLWGQLALALYRSSRQADALRAIGTAREQLLDELGLDPGPELRELEQRILAQDPTLLLPLSTAHTERSTPLHAPAATTELIGREDEHRTVLAALEAVDMRPQLVLLEGEPGIGKSTLCDATVAEAIGMGWRTAVGRCVEAGLAPSLWPMIELARGLLADAAGQDEDVPNPWRRLADGRDGGGASHVELAEQLVALLDDIDAGPFLLVLDDLHWVDQATIDVLRLMLDRIGARRIVVLGSHRPVDLVPDSLLGPMLGALHRTAVDVTRVQLSPLDTSGVAQLMALTTGVAPSAEVAAKVQARAGGNPLFVAELARLAGDRGLSDDSVVPDAIVDVVRDRLARLPERATAELEVAAVLGERFDLRTAMAASERTPDACLDALDAAIVTRILVPEAGGFRFAHALVRDAVLAQLSPLRRARLHHRAAEAIIAVSGEGPDAAEPIAHHRLASASFADPLVVAKALVRASDVARWRGALDAADQFAEHALTTIDGLPRTPATTDVEVDALEAVVSAAIRREDPVLLQRATERVARLAESTGSHAVLALSLFLEWGDVDGTDDLHSLEPDLDRVKSLAAVTDDPYATVTTSYMIASAAFLGGRFPEAEHHLDAAIAASGAVSPDDRPAHVPLVLLPVVAALVSAMLDKEDDAIVHSHRRAAAWFSLRSEVDPSASLALAFNRALVHAVLDQPQEVIDDLAGRPRTMVGALVAHQPAACDLLVAWAQTRLGDPHLDDAFEAIVAVEASAERTLRGALLTFLGDACLRVGDDRAEEVLARAHREATTRGEEWWLAETLRLQARAAARRGDVASSREHLDAARALAREQGAALLLRRLDGEEPT